MRVSEKLKELGIKVEYVSKGIAQMLMDGWASLAF